MAGLTEFIGRNVFVKLNSGRVYSGKVKDVSFLGKDSQDIDKHMIFLIDKYNSLVCFTTKDIIVLEEEK